MSKTVSPKSGAQPDALSISMSIDALTYSSSDCSSLSSCDHSTLKPMVCMSMQGRGISSSSLICTVFNSITRPPASQDNTIFCASCVCGPAAGPNGVAARWPCTERERSSAAPWKKRVTGRSKAAFFCASSRNKRTASTPKGIGASSLIFTHRHTRHFSSTYPIKQYLNHRSALPFDTGKDHADRSAVIALAQSAGEARGAGRRSLNIGIPQREVARTGDCTLVHDHWPPATRAHAFDHGPPVVGLVVEDTAGEAYRRRFPSPHETRAMTRRFGEIEAIQFVPRALQWCATRGLDRYQSGHCRNGAKPFCDFEPLRQRTRQRATTDLDEERVGGAARSGEGLRHLEGERTAAFDRKPVFGPLHAERNGALRNRFAKTPHAWITYLARLALAYGDVRS